MQLTKNGFYSVLLLFFFFALFSCGQIQPGGQQPPEKLINPIGGMWSVDADDFTINGMHYVLVSKTGIKEAQVMNLTKDSLEVELLKKQLK